MFNEKDTLVIDRGGGTDESLGTLEALLKKIAADHRKGQPVKIYELRDYNKESDITMIGFYLNSPRFSGVIGHSFWIPKKKEFMDPDLTGGRGTRGYQEAISLIYRYLTHQPRVVIDLNKKKVESMLSDPYALDKSIASCKIKKVIDEDRSVLPRIMETLTRPPHDISFIAIGTELARGLARTPRYMIGCSWDLFHGLRLWEEGQGEDLREESERFDKIVTYNDRLYYFDLDAKQSASEELRKRNKGKTIDLHKIISAGTDEYLRYRRKGELTLDNVGFATLSLCNRDLFEKEYWNLNEWPAGPRKESLDTSIVDHCARDAEIIKELFFYVLENHAVLSTSHDPTFDRRFINHIPLGNRLHEALDKNYEPEE